MAGSSLTSGDDYRYPLFDGETLSGWNVEGDCQVEVNNGVIQILSGTGWLRSSHEYRDFTLSLEWKADQSTGYNSGVFFRAAGSGQSYPGKGFEVDIMPGAVGHIAKRAGGKTSVSIAQPLGWNQLEIDVTGQQATVKVNGVVSHGVNDLDEMTGAIGLQVTVPVGGKFQFRNVMIVEKGFRTLFNGQDFSSWEGADQPAEKCWAVENGQLIGLPVKGPWLRSKDEFSDFNLRLEYQVQPGANSGVFLRVPANGNHHRKTSVEADAGIEVQILDDSATKYANLKDYQYCGSLYDLAGAMKHLSRPTGTWNTLELNCNGNHYTSIHNGVTIVSVDAKQTPLLLLRKQSGFLGLQNHGGGVKFRNIRIGAPTGVE